jgi:hypothetical protein
VFLSDCYRWRWSRTAHVFAPGVFVFWLGSFLASLATAAEPPPELAAAARDFRIEIYGAFRTNRAEYDARRKQAEALLAEWQTRGALPEEAAVLVRWFDAARRASAQQQPLPAAPNWNGSSEELISVPARAPSSSPRPASQILLRALPVKRMRLGRQVQVTAISGDIMRPRETRDSFTLLAALPDASSLALVLDLPNSVDERASLAADLPKSAVLTHSSINTTPVPSPEPKTMTTANEPTTKTDRVPEAAELNTAELRARLRGYDKAWRALQADLYSDEVLTLERADALLTILYDLGQARRDLQLYQAIAPAELREELRGLAALEELQTQLRKIMQAARNSDAANLALEPAQRAALERAWVKLLQMK